MKASPAILAALADLDRIEKGTQISRVLGELLLGMARGEVSADKVEAAAKAVAAESMRKHNDMKLSMWALQIRTQAADLYLPKPEEE